MSPRRRRLTIAASVLLALGLVALLARPLAAQRLTGLFFQPWPGPVDPPTGESLRVEEIAFPASDGARLEGWWFAASGMPRGVILFVHGNGANLSRQWHEPARFSDRGFDVLVFDYRGFGDSEGRVCRANAREDVLSALAVARVRSVKEHVPLFVTGQSMGAALVLETLSDRAAPEGVVAMVADSPFSSWEDIASYTVASSRAGRRVAGSCLHPLLAATGRDPIDAVRAGVSVPLMIIGNELDPVTPPEMARTLADASKAKLLMLDGEKHPGSRTDAAETRVIDEETAFFMAPRSGP